MSELIKKIDGLNVLFIDEKVNLREEILNYKDKEIDLVIVGDDHSKLTKILNGRSLSEFISNEKNKSTQLNIEQITSMQTQEIIIEKLPTIVEPFIDKTNYGWRGEPKWYDQKKKRKK